MLIPFVQNAKESNNLCYAVGKALEAKKAAAQSIVLFKNEGNMLPLKKGTRVALIGDFAKTPRYPGAGSSLVNPTKTPESMVECIKNSELECISYAQGYIRNKKTDDKLVHEAVAAAKQAKAILHGYLGGQAGASMMILHAFVIIHPRKEAVNTEKHCM